jgi:HK97 family phage portal protein
MLNFLKKKQQIPFTKNYTWYQGHNLTSNGFEEKSIKEGYVENAVSFACINKVAGAVANLPFELKKGDDVVEEENNPVVKLLKNPNPFFDWKAFTVKNISYYLLTGDTYIWKNDVNKPDELLCLYPPDMDIEYHNNNYYAPKNYRYGSGSGYKLYPIDPITFESEIAHMYNFNPYPSSMLNGMSPITPLSRNIDIVNRVFEWNLSLLRNGGKPSGAVVAKAAAGQAPVYLDEEKFAALKKQIEEHVSGSTNAGRPLLLEGGLEWQQIGINPSDMDFVNSFKESGKLICSVFGVPSQLIFDTESSTFANKAEAKLEFYKDTVIPLAELYVEFITKKVISGFDESLELVFNKDKISALQPERDARFAKVQTADFMTINEKRDVVGLEPIEGGDSLYINPNQIPLDAI